MYSVNCIFIYRTRIPHLRRNYFGKSVAHVFRRFLRQFIFITKNLCKVLARTNVMCFKRDRRGRHNSLLHVKWSKF